MKKYYIFIILFLLLPVNVYAGRGCCSSHGGAIACFLNQKQKKQSSNKT